MIISGSVSESYGNVNGVVLPRLRSGAGAANTSGSAPASPAVPEVFWSIKLPPIVGKVFFAGVRSRLQFLMNPEAFTVFMTTVSTHVPVSGTPLNAAVLTVKPLTFLTTGNANVRPSGEVNVIDEGVNVASPVML